MSDRGQLKRVLRGAFDSYEKVACFPKNVVDSFLEWLSECAEVSWLSECTSGPVGISGQHINYDDRNFTYYECDSKVLNMPPNYNDAALTFSCDRRNSCGFKFKYLDLQSEVSSLFRRALRENWEFYRFKEKLLSFGCFLKFPSEALVSLEQVWLKGAENIGFSVFCFGWDALCDPIIEEFKKKNPELSDCWKYSGVVLESNGEKFLLPFCCCEVVDYIVSNLREVLNGVEI